eukprot:756498-Hanusia_phi.AAC.2
MAAIGLRGGGGGVGGGGALVGKSMAGRAGSGLEVRQRTALASSEQTLWSSLTADGNHSTCGSLDVTVAGVREAMWTWRQTVRIFQKGDPGGGGEKEEGRMEYDIMSWSSVVRLKNGRGETLATSKHEMRGAAGDLFPHDVVVVEDCAGNKLGEVTEELQSVGMGSVVLFTFADADGRVFASSSPRGAGMVVHDAMSGKNMVSLRKTTTFGDLRDSWRISMSNSTGRALGLPPPPPHVDPLTCRRPSAPPPRHCCSKPSGCLGGYRYGRQRTYISCNIRSYGQERTYISCNKRSIHQVGGSDGSGLRKENGNKTDEAGMAWRRSTVTSQFDTERGESSALAPRSPSPQPQPPRSSVLSPVIVGQYPLSSPSSSAPGRPALALNPPPLPSSSLSPQPADPLVPSPP